MIFLGRQASRKWGKRKAVSQVRYGRKASGKGSGCGEHQRGKGMDELKVVRGIQKKPETKSEIDMYAGE